MQQGNALQRGQGDEAVPETPEAEDEGQEVPDVASLKDPELFQLLEEAYSYKRPRDRQGKSEIFRVSTNYSTDWRE